MSEIDVNYEEILHVDADQALVVVPLEDFVAVDEAGRSTGRRER